MKKRKIGAVLVAAVLVCISLAGCANKADMTNSKVTDQKNNNYVLASGVIESENQYTVTSSAQADILSDPFDEGDTVKAGQVLYTLDKTDFLANVKKAKNAVDSAKLSYDLNKDNIRKLSVTADCSGTVTNLYADTGNMLTAGFKVADVVDDSKMKLTLPFLTDTASGIYVGQSAQVSLVGTFYGLNGTVSHVSSGDLVTASGSKVNMVEVTVDNPGTLKKGDKATATINGIACNDAGTFDYYQTGAITTEVAGKVERKNVKVGDKVNAGTVAIVMSSDALKNQEEQYALNIQSAQLALNTLLNNEKDYTITSKIDGTVIKKNVKKNDALNAANMGNMAVIADLANIKVKVQVDEMDVGHIKIGESVPLTTDANPSKKYTGVVDSVGKSGTITNGVALYDVKIAIHDIQDLLPGMNVTAKFDLRK